MIGTLPFSHGLRNYSSLLQFTALTDYAHGGYCRVMKEKYNLCITVLVEKGECTTQIVLRHLDWKKIAVCWKSVVYKPKLIILCMEETFPRNECLFSVVGLIFLYSANSDLSLFLLASCISVISINKNSM